MQSNISDRIAMYPEKRRGMKNILREILSTSLYLLVVLCLTYLVIHFVGQRTVVDGSSMESTLSDE